jgi:hypothetical protein
VRSRAQGITLLAGLLLVAVVIPTTLAYAAGCHRNDTQITDLQTRLRQVEVDTQVLSEELDRLLDE